MLKTIETTILSGGRIEISSPDLIAGQKARVTVVVENEPIKKRSAVDILAEASGQRLFKTAEDVDVYIREERDSWES